VLARKSARFRRVIRGALGKIRRIAIVGGPIKPAIDYRPTATAPCGRCRQLLAEAAMVAGTTSKCGSPIWANRHRVPNDLRAPARRIQRAKF
jgi:hypothetical protein